VTCGHVLEFLLDRVEDGHAAAVPGPHFGGDVTPFGHRAIVWPSSGGRPSIVREVRSNANIAMSGTYPASADVRDAHHPRGRAV
jgi:hypothetical protein